MLRVIFLDRVGGVLRILGAYKFIDEKALRRFLLSCQSRVYGSLLYYATNKDMLSEHKAVKGSCPQHSIAILLYLLRKIHPVCLLHISDIVLSFCVREGGFRMKNYELHSL